MTTVFENFARLVEEVALKKERDLIQELYEQSWVEGSYQEPVQGEMGDEQRYRTVKTSNFDHKHFAEMIIRECSRICYDEDFVSGSGYAQEITKRFGLEE